MTLKVLLIEEEPEVDISYVPAGSNDEPEIDPELPDQFMPQDSIDLLLDSAASLESIGAQIACEGMSLSVARELEKIDPTFIRRNGGASNFTSQPSLEGLADGVNTVKDKILSVIKRIAGFIRTFYENVVKWLTEKLSRPEAQDIKQEVEEFLAERRNRDAMTYIASLPDDVEEAAAEIARFMDGDTKEFASNLVNQLQVLGRQVEHIESLLKIKRIPNLIATGQITVEELFKEEADSYYRDLLNKASTVAQTAIRARSQEEFLKAMEAVDNLSEELGKATASTVLGAALDQDNQEFDKNTSSVPFDKLYDNLHKATQALMRVDSKQRMDELKQSIEKSIIGICDDKYIESLLHLLSEDMTTDQQQGYAKKISTMYRQISLLGRTLMSVWKERVDTLMSLNKFGDSLINLVGSFEKSVITAGGSLTSEQKAQLSKAMAGKGLKVVF